MNHFRDEIIEVMRGRTYRDVKELCSEKLINYKVISYNRKGIMGYLIGDDTLCIALEGSDEQMAGDFPLDARVIRVE